MNIFLTGGNGLVGKNILANSKKEQYKFIYPSSQELNLLYKKEIEDFFKKNKIDLVIHAAGVVGGINANIKNPVKFLHENVEMGINLISASKEANIKNFINLSSSCMYPCNAKNPLSEDMILTGDLEPTNEGYALAKIVVTKICDYISKEGTDFRYKTLIPCNLYGKYDNFDLDSSHMIPGVISRIHDAKINSKKIVEIWGDGSARREFMLASSFADFIYFAIENFEKMPDILNVGLGKDYSILEYYEAISNVIGYKGEFSYDLSKPTGMKQKLVDSSNLERFGWSNNVTLTEGIIEAYNYFKDTHGL